MKMKHRMRVHNSRINNLAEEKRQNIFANVNRDPEMINRIMGHGITPNYQEMLRDGKRYLVTKGIIGQEDKDDRIILNKREGDMN